MKYISLNQYMKKYNIGYNVALQMISSGKLDYMQTTSGHYKIAIYDERTIPFEKYEKVLQENEKLKTIIRNILSISKEALYE